MNAYLGKYQSLTSHLPAMKGLLLELSSRLGCKDDISNLNVVYLDIETTGVQLGKSSIWQIASVRFSGGKEVERFNRIIKITREAFESCPLEVRQSIHLDWDVVSAGEDEAVVLNDLLAFLSKDKSPILGHNIRSFDLGHLGVACMKYPSLDKQMFEAAFAPARIIDTGVIVKAAQMNRVFFPNETAVEFMEGIRNERIRSLRWSLAYVVEQLGLTLTGNAHDALIDCLTLHNLITRIIEAVESGKEIQAK